MDAGSLLVGIGLAVAVAAFVARPLREKRALHGTGGDHQVSALRAERDALLTMIRELEMDHAMGKIADGDFLAQRAVLVGRGASVLRQLDEHAAAPAARDEVEAAIKAAVAARRGRAATPAARFCTHCGRDLQPEDRFCAHCGKPVRGEKSA